METSFESPFNVQKEPLQAGARPRARGKKMDGWMDRLKRSVGAKFKLMVVEEDMFLCAVEFI